MQVTSAIKYTQLLMAQCYTLKTSNPLPNSESLLQQTPEEAMDTKRDVNVASLCVQRKPEVEKNGGWRCFMYDGRQHNIPTPLPSRQTSRHSVWVPGTLPPQMRGQSHEYSGSYGQRWPLQFIPWSQLGGACRGRTECSAPGQIYI